MKVQIEFHEKKSRIKYIETQIKVENIIDFLKWSIGEKWTGKYGGKEQTVEYELKRLEKSKAKRPSFEIFIRQKKVTVYPQENLITGIEARLHYVCQHSFDMFPNEYKDRLYGYTSGTKIGLLHTLKGEEFMVYTNDILSGFMLPSTKEQLYKADFVKWIKSRTEIRKKQKEKTK